MNWFLRILFGWRKKRVTGQLDYTLNLKKDKVDKRDILVPVVGLAVSKKFSLRKFCPPIKNQGSIGSCAAFAYATAYEIMRKQRGEDVACSELFHYYEARKLEGTLPNDKGMTLRAGAKVLERMGIALDLFCPYDVSKFNDEPSFSAYFTARMLRIKRYERVWSVGSIKEVVETMKKPVVFGMSLTQQFIGNRTGQIKFPPSNMEIKGGHAMVIIGFDDSIKSFEVHNSWDTRWGEDGYGWIPYDVLKKYFMDAWVLTLR